MINVNFNILCIKILNFNYLDNQTIKIDKSINKTIYNLQFYLIYKILTRRDILCKINKPILNCKFSKYSMNSYESFIIIFNINKVFYGNEKIYL